MKNIQTIIYFTSRCRYSFMLLSSGIVQCTHNVCNVYIVHAMCTLHCTLYNMLSRYLCIIWIKLCENLCMFEMGGVWVGGWWCVLVTFAPHVNASISQRVSFSARSVRDCSSQNNLTVKMKKFSLSRLVLILFCAVVFVVVLIINALAGAGKGTFYTPCLLESVISLTIICVSLLNLVQKISFLRESMCRPLKTVKMRFNIITFHVT